MAFIKTSKTKIVLSLLLDLAILIAGGIALFREIFLSSLGNGSFRYFTIDGNIYCVMVALLTAIFDGCALFGKRLCFTKVLFYFRLGAAVTGILIFLVVIFLLVPAMGIGILTGYDLIVLHAVLPTLCLIAFLFFAKREDKKTWVVSLWGGAPVFLYGGIAIILVLTKVWQGDLIPYPFLHLYENPIWASGLYVVGILGGSWGLSLLFLWLQKKIAQPASTKS